MNRTPLPASSRHKLTPDMEICRVLNGMWQVSGGHGRIDAGKAVEAMGRYIDAGFTTWDLADHYGPAEDFIGEFRRRSAKALGEDDSISHMQAFTKWVPSPGVMSREVVERNITRSLQRMDVKSLDLLQFHWWEYSDPRYLDALARMNDLRAAGKIRYLGLTNFDTERLELILSKGIPIVSNQVQYSLIDRRPEKHMVPLCKKCDVQLLTYGTVCGGFLSDAYVDRPEPRGSALSTVSLQKYKQMVDAWGGWEMFQVLLKTLKRIATRHQTTVANVAVRYILDKPAVAGVIVGVRLGLSEHIDETAKVFDFKLDKQDLAQIEEVLSKSNDLFASVGDCGDEYRG